MAKKDELWNLERYAKYDLADANGDLDLNKYLAAIEKNLDKIPPKSGEIIANQLFSVGTAAGLDDDNDIWDAIIGYLFSLEVFSSMDTLDSRQQETEAIRKLIHDYRKENGAIK